MSFLCLFHILYLGLKVVCVCKIYVVFVVQNTHKTGCRHKLGHSRSWFICLDKCVVDCGRLYTFGILRNQKRMNSAWNCKFTDLTILCRDCNEVLLTWLNEMDALLSSDVWCIKLGSHFSYVNVKSMQNSPWYVPPFSLSGVKLYLALLLGLMLPVCSLDSDQSSTLMMMWWREWQLSLD